MGKVRCGLGIYKGVEERHARQNFDVAVSREYQQLCESLAYWLTRGIEVGNLDAPTAARYALEMRHRTE